MRRSEKSGAVYNLPPLKSGESPDKHKKQAGSRTTFSNKHVAGKDKLGERNNSSHSKHGERSEMTILGTECYNRFNHLDSDRYVDENDLESGRFMCSPAPREMSGDSIASSDSNGSKGKVNASGFPAITVEKCDERLSSPSPSLTSAAARSRTLDSTDVTTSLLVPSPVMQRKYRDGRPVVITHNLHNLKTFCKSDGNLNQIVCPRSQKNLLDASFRPQPVTRPAIHASREVSSEEVAELKASRSPSPTSRRLRVRGASDRQRARSTSDIMPRR